MKLEKRYYTVQKMDYFTIYKIWSNLELRVFYFIFKFSKALAHLSLSRSARLFQKLFLSWLEEFCHSTEGVTHNLRIAHYLLYTTACFLASQSPEKPDYDALFTNTLIFYFVCSNRRSDIFIPSGKHQPRSIIYLLANRAFVKS